jgi:hypothetical protein
MPATYPAHFSLLIWIDNKKFWEDLMAYDKDRIENVASLFRIFCCRGNVYTKMLPSNYKGDASTNTRTDEKYLWSRQLSWAQVP